MVAVLLGSAPISQGSTSTGESPAPPVSDPILQGRRLFEEKGCTRCHGVWGRDGEGRVGPDLGDKGAAWRDMMGFAGSLWNHTPAMLRRMREREIERAAISPEEMGKIAAYLFYVKQLGGPGDVERGRQLFEERSCARCHQLAGRGGTTGPRLDDLKDHVSTFFMAQALWNHGPEMAEKMAELGIGRPRLGAQDVKHIVAFLRGDGRPPEALEIAYSQAGSPQVGEVLFRERGCVRCHAVGGAGGHIGPDLGEQRPKEGLAEMAGAFWNHGPPMWAKMKELGVPFPKLSDREMSDVLAYLFFVQHSGPRGDVAKGAEVFREKACDRCHAAGGKGAKVAPDLASTDATRSVLHWISAIWNHSPAMEQKVQEMQTAWPRFADDEMRDLVEFLRARRAPS